MNKRLVLLSILLVISIICLCGCTKKCDSCGKEIKNDKDVVEIRDNKYCKKCVEYCSECNAGYPKDDKALLKYKDKKYCKDCFEKIAYPIILQKNDKIEVAITGYNDESGEFAVRVKNKTNLKMSVYQNGDSALLDGKDKCIGETSGTHSFAYTDVPKNEETTVFSTFRKGDSDVDWETVLKPSEGHSFEFVLNAFITDNNYDDFWGTTFKVKLTPEMFGYSK